MKYLKRIDENFDDDLFNESEEVLTCEEILYPLTDDGNSILVFSDFNSKPITGEYGLGDINIYGSIETNKNYHNEFKQLFRYLNNQGYELNKKSHMLIMTSMKDVSFKYKKQLFYDDIIKFIENNESEQIKDISFTFSR